MDDNKDQEPGSAQETSIVQGSAADPLNQVFAQFMAHHTPFGFKAHDQENTFHPLPYKPEGEEKLLIPRPWRVLLELQGQATGRMVMGLDLYGDVILGRGPSRPGRIIIGLDDFDALDLGVSREHAMLRPTRTHLFVIDQGSTNGTTINGALSGRGIATPLKHEDLVGVGNLLIMVHILAEPGSPTD